MTTTTRRRKQPGEYRKRRGPMGPRFDSLKPGTAVLLDFCSGTQSYGRVEPALFVGIEGTGDDRRATFVQVTDQPFLKGDDRKSYEWQAYRYEGRWAFGSSADVLRLHRVLAEPPE